MARFYNDGGKVSIRNCAMKKVKKKKKNLIFFLERGYQEHFVASRALPPPPPRKEPLPLKCKERDVSKVKNWGAISKPTTAAFADRLMWSQLRFCKKCKMGPKHKGNTIVPFIIAAISEAEKKS